MKVVKVRIRKKRLADRTEFQWPDIWHKYHEKMDVVAYEDEGKAIEYALAVGDDAIVEALLEEADPKDVEPISVAEADQLGKQWRPQVERVHDPEKVVKILAKVARGEPLTEAERNAIDPNHPEPGIGKSPEFSLARIAKDRGDEVHEHATR